jgi:hypothetical protein
VVRAAWLAPFFAVLATLAACAETSPMVQAPAAARVGPQPGEFPDEPSTLLRFRSARFGMSVPLPDGRAWRIDDHKGPSLVAEHAPTRSTLALQVFTGPEVMNRQKCEARARDLGLASLKDARTIEDLVTVGPEAYDSRIWVAVEPGTSYEAPLVGHAFLFGAFVRKCLFVHYATRVASEREEPLLTSRLVVARLRILGGLEVLPFDQAPKAPP